MSGLGEEEERFGGSPRWRALWRSDVEASVLEASVCEWVCGEAAWVDRQKRDFLGNIVCVMSIGLALQRAAGMGCNCGPATAWELDLRSDDALVAVACTSMLQAPEH